MEARERRLRHDLPPGSGLRHAGDEPDHGEAVGRGGHHHRAFRIQHLQRLREPPIIISRDPLFYDLAITIAFGLAFATVLTLGLAPVLYATVLRVPSPSRGSSATEPRA